MRRVAILLAAIALVAAACGDSDEEPVARSGEPDATSVADGTAIDLAAKDTAFDKIELTAAAGTVTIHFDNQDDGIMHNLYVSGSGVDEKTEIETGPTSQSLDLDLESGSYTYVCDVHPQQMKGDLEVT